MKLTYSVRMFAACLALVSGPLAADLQEPPLLPSFEAELPVFIDTWKTLVNIDSGTGDTEGLGKMEAVIVQRLHELGASVQTVPVNPGTGNVITGTLEGTGQKRIMLMIHYDTVFKAGEAAKRPFRIEHGQVFGPGAADAKGGVALVLHALKLLRAMDYQRYGRLTVLFNPDEEESSLGSRDLIRQTAAEQDYVLSFEPPDRDIVTVATNGIARVHLLVKGLASHAGSAPEKGRNAAIEQAYQLLQLNGLGDPAKKTTVNWTVLRAGDKVNIIPDTAQATADMRFSEYNELQRVRQQAEKIVQQHFIPGTEVSVNVENRRPPLPSNRASEMLAETAVATGREIGYELESASMRFGTDAGFAYDPVNETPAVLETMGIVGKRIHSPDEFAEIGSVIPRLYLTVRMIQVLSER